MGPPIKDALNMVPLGLAASKAETAASAELHRNVQWLLTTGPILSE